MEKYEDLQILNFRRCGKTQRKRYIMNNKNLDKLAREYYESKLEALLEKLSEVDPEDERFEMLDEKFVKVLNEYRELDKSDRKKLDPNVFVPALFGMANLLITLNFEKTGCITTKAFSKFVR